MSGGTISVPGAGDACRCSVCPALQFHGCPTMDRVSTAAAHSMYSRQPSLSTTCAGSWLRLGVQNPFRCFAAIVMMAAALAFTFQGAFIATSEIATGENSGY